MIYLIFGASGSGKTPLIGVLRDLPNISIHIKGTTRQLRQYDKGELVSVNQDQLSRYEYIYSQYGYEYGIEKKQITNSVLSNTDHFVICNDISVIREIKRDFINIVKVIYYYYTATEKAIKSIQQEYNISDDEIKLRVSKIESLFRLFNENSILFEHIIFVNHEITSKDDLSRQIHTLLGDYDTAPEKLALLFERLSHDKKQIPKRTIQEKLLFLIMAMDETKPELKDIHYMIETSAREEGFLTERVDYVPGFGPINEKLYHHIELAEIIIADLTYERPNCYYEIGYAHGRGKNVILTAKSGTTIHFDLQNYNVLRYKNLTELMEKIKITLRNHKTPCS